MLLYKDIIKENDPLLRKKSIDVCIPLSDEDINTITLMNEYLTNGYDSTFSKENRPGVGLACVQIGIPKKILCILAHDEDNSIHEYNMINPKIISHSLELTYLDNGEGCLSVESNYKGLVHRYKKVKVKTHLYNIKTQQLTYETITLNGYLSVVFQHEYDHLQGILFFDRINNENPFEVPLNSKVIEFKNN